MKSQIMSKRLSSLPTLSVIIPTRNRGTLLSSLLKAFYSQQYPMHLFEIIVVDNGSTTNQTHQVVKRWQAKIKNLRYVKEDRPGASWSRNRGIRVARFLHLVFVDDDVHFGPHFLAGYAAAWQRYPQARILGGGITTALTTGQSLTPTQLRLVDTYPWCFTHRGEIDHDQKVDVGHFIYSANMSYRRKGRESQVFSTRLGVQLFQNEQFGGEDFELCVRTQLRGEQVVLLGGPATEVRHHVTPDRFDKEYIYRRHLWAGIEMAVLETEVHKNVPTFHSFFRTRMKSITGIWQLVSDRYVRAMWLSYWFNGRFFKTN